MAIVGALTYVSLIAIGVPFAIPLSLIVAFGELIPLVGSWLARIPLLAIAALDSPRTFVLTFVASIVIQNLQGDEDLAGRRGRSARKTPAARVRRSPRGSLARRAVGAFAAVPAAAIVDLVTREVVVPWRRAQLQGTDRRRAAPTDRTRAVRYDTPMAPAATRLARLQR